MYKPVLKSYKEIVKTAARLFNISELDAEIEMDKRLRALKIPKIAIVLYVNWANCLVPTYDQLAAATNLTVVAVTSYFRIIRRRFPYLFLGATPPA